MHSHFYGLAADRQEYCFTTDFLYKKTKKTFFFINLILELKYFFFHIRIKNLWRCGTLVFQQKKFPSKKIKCRFFCEFFKFSVKKNK